CPPVHRENVAPAQAAPDRRQLFYAGERRIAGVIGAVERADAGADDHVGGDAAGRERMQHARLDSAETAAAGEHKGGFRFDDVSRHGNATLLAPPCRGVSGAAPDLRSVTGIGWRSGAKVPPRGPCRKFDFNMARFVAKISSESAWVRQPCCFTLALIPVRC